MAKFPEPPSARELAERLEPEIRRLARGTRLWRVYYRGGPHPTRWPVFRAFGPTSARFDHHLTDASGRPRVQERKVLHAAEQGLTSLAEVFQDTRVIDREAKSPWLVAFRLRRGLSLLDLTGTWPTRAGASMKISTGPRPRARRWSRAIYDAYPGVEGLYYPSSMQGNEPCLALYERAEDALRERPDFHRPLADPVLFGVLRNAAADLGYGLV